MFKKERYGCKWTWKTIQRYTETYIQVKEQLVVRKDMDVIGHETSKVHLDIHLSKGTACCQKGYGCKWT